MRDPKDAPPDTLRAIKDLRRAIEDLRTGNLDLGRRRVVNAHDAVERGDYITKRQFDDTIASLKTQAVKAARANSLSAVGIPSVPSGGLPVPNHAMDFGYWLADGNRPPDIDDFFAEVQSYTNLYVAWGSLGRQYGDSSTPETNFFSNMASRVARAFNANKSIYLIMGLDSPYGSITNHTDKLLTAVAPYWNRVRYVDMGDEPGWDAARTNTEIATLKAAMTAKALAIPLIGMTFAYTTQKTDPGLLAGGLDFASIEAYCDTSLQNNETSVINFVTSLIDNTRSRIPSKKKFIILQGYARNVTGGPTGWPSVEPNNWMNMATLAKLNETGYMLAKDDTTVLGMTIFSYGRYSGVKEQLLEGSREVNDVHRKIWTAIGGLAGGSSGSNRCAQGRPCCGGQGNPDNCPRWCSGGDYQELVASAYFDYIASAPPTVIDPSNPTIILDIPTFMAGVVNTFNLENSNLIAQISPGHDGKEITVKTKGDNEFSEQYALWAANSEIISWSGNPPRAYRATCYPAQI